MLQGKDKDMITVRRMKEEDLDSVRRIELQCISEPWSREAFMDTLKAEQYLPLVAEAKGSVIGYCIFMHAADEGEIPKICVDEEFRRRGAGMLLLCAACEEAKACGVSALYLEVRRSNLAAQRLYDKAGFEQLGIRKGFYERPKEDALLMRYSV